jgi:hypothetical protein
LTIDIHEDLPGDFVAHLHSFRTAGGFETLAVPWSLLARDTNPGRVELRWIVVRRGTKVCGLGVAHLIRRLAVGDYVGGVVERLTNVGRRLGYTPLAFDVAYLEAPSTNRPGLYFAPDECPAERARITRRVATVLAETLPVDAVCLKATDDEPLRGCEDMGLAALPFEPGHVLELPGSPPTVETWLSALGPDRRSNTRRNSRAFHKSGAVLETVLDPAPHAARLAELYRRTALQARANGGLPMPLVVGPGFFESFQRHLGNAGHIRLARIDQAVIGFAVWLFGHDTAFLRYVGLDYDRSQDTRAYFHFYHEGVATACYRGMRFIDMGTGSTHVKAPLGGRPVATAYHIRFQRWLRPWAGILTRMLDRRFGQLSRRETKVAPGPSQTLAGSKAFSARPVQTSRVPPC